MSIRYLVYATDSVTEIIKSVLNSLSSEVIVAVDPNNFRDNGQIDIAIVDMQKEKAEIACAHIQERLGIPLALLVDSEKTDWAKCGTLDVCGYVPLSAGYREMEARLKALSRKIPVTAKSG